MTTLRTATSPCDQRMRARCQVYALTQRPGTPSRPLRLNFYEQPKDCLEVIASLLQQDNQTSNYIRSFYSVGLPDLAEIAGMDDV